MDNFDFNDIEEISDEKLALSNLMSEIFSLSGELVVTEENMESVKIDFRKKLEGIDYYLDEDEIKEDIDLSKEVAFFKDAIKKTLKEKGIDLDT